MKNIPKWLQVARDEEAKGIHEWPGRWQDNPEILKYFDAVSYHATHDEVPWCSAFVNWCMVQAGIQGSGSAAAISYLHWGRRLGEPQLGCIVVWEHHVSFFVGYEDDDILCLGGNQSDSVKVSRYSQDNVLSYRWPDE